MDGLNSVLWIARIQQHYEMLPKTERKVADYLLRDPQSAAEMSSIELSKVSGTSPATVMRFCRSIGFNGFSEFKIYVRSEKLAPYEDPMRIEHGDPISAIKQKSFRYGQSVLEETMNILDDKMLSAAVSAIDKAREVIIVGIGGSGSTGRCVYDSLLQIDVPCHFIEDPIFQILAIAKLKPGDVVIACCHSGKTIDVLDACVEAKKRGVTVIGLIGITGSPLTKIVDISLMTGLSNHQYYSDTLAARICELGVVATLHTALSLIRRESLRDNRRRITDLINIKRTQKPALPSVRQFQP